MSTRDTRTRRDILFAARMRFSAEAAPVREQAIDRIVKHCILRIDTGYGATVAMIERHLGDRYPISGGAITRLDIETGMHRLRRANQVCPHRSGLQRAYTLTPEAQAEVKSEEQSAERLFERVLRRVFADAPGQIGDYADPFLHCLCMVFSQLAESYVQIITGHAEPDAIAATPSLTAAIKNTLRVHSNIDASSFERGILSFFRTRDAEYDQIKWNMAQNYYIAAALGLDATGGLLSKEVFGDAIFYLDTNVVVEALEETARSHPSFNAFCAACRRLGIDIKVCQISIDELRRVIDYYTELIPKVAPQIPDAIAPNVRGIFYEIWREAANNSQEVDLAHLYSRFLNPMATLAGNYGVELINDRWFHADSDQRLIQRMRSAVSQSSQKRRKKVKMGASAWHDALLLSWVTRERERTVRNVWVVTLDQSLPGVASGSPGQSRTPLAITLDALLQWLSPLAGDLEDVAVAAFAEAVRYQPLPQEQLFDLRDFLVFAEMGLSCKELPPEQVEDCIRYFKSQAPGLDPSNPADREKITREVRRYFAAVEDEARHAYRRQIADLTRQVEEAQQRESKLRGKLIANRERSHKDQLRRSARWRLTLVCLLFLICEAAVVALAHRFGTGTNLVQRLLAFWPLISLVSVLAVVAAWFILGRERIKALGWPFTRLFRTD